MMDQIRQIELPRDQRSFQRLLFVVGALAVMVFYGLPGSSSRSKELASMELNEDNQEDFATSKRSSVNTIKLPVRPDFMSEPFDSTKPNLILHVGPVKTGTKKLHEQLMDMNQALQTDKMVVLDDTTFDISALYSTCQQVLVDTRDSYNSKKFISLSKPKPLASQLASIPCWKRFLTSLDPYRQQGMSVIVSNDLLSQQFLPDVTGIGPAVLDWVSVKETLMKDWNIVVIATYRRYFDWLPSAKAADEQVHLQQRTSELPRLARWPGTDNGMILEPMFPHFFKNGAEKLDVPYTTRIRELYKPYVSEVKVLDMYSKGQSVRTTFLCDMVNATSSCSLSKQKDVQDAKEFLEPEAILETQADSKWREFQIYDELVTNAASHGLLRTKFCTRTTAIATTQYYVEHYLEIKPRIDLPVTCPPENALHFFLDESLRYEKAVGVSSDTEEHVQAFQIVAEREEFCNINMRKLFRERSWRAFFRHLNNNSAKRIQAGGTPGSPNGRRWLRELLE